MHFHCFICEGGDYNLCLSCKKSSKVCPGRHKMVKRQLPIDSKTGGGTTKKNASVRSPVLNPPNSSTKKSETVIAKRGTTEYCNIKGCGCGLPKKPKATSAAAGKKKKAAVNNQFACLKCGASFDARGALFTHLREKNHMVD